MKLHKSMKDDFYFEADEQEQETEFEQDTNLEYVKVQACINIAKIDSDFSEEEIEFLTNLIDQADLNPEEKTSLLDSLRHKELNDIDFKQYKGNSLFASSLLDILIEIIYIDGIVAPSERIYLYVIAQSLGIDRELVKDMLDSYRQDKVSPDESSE